MTQAPLIFDSRHGERAREAALDAHAEALAFDTWWRAAERAVLHLATERAEFGTDDVWELLQRIGVPRPAEPRALGALMRLLARQRRIESTGGYRKTTLASAHRRPVALWRLRRIDNSAQPTLGKAP